MAEDRAERIERVLEVAARAGCTEQEQLVLRYLYSGCNLSEAAEQAHVSRPTLYRILAAARRRLGARWQEMVAEVLMSQAERVRELREEYHMLRGHVEEVRAGRRRWRPPATGRGGLAPLLDARGRVQPLSAAAFQPEDLFSGAEELR